VTKRVTKWGRIAVILAVIALSCFVFAGIALAQSINMTAGENPVTGELTSVVKADHVYDFTITATGVDVDVNLFCEGDLLGKDPSELNQLYIDFPFPEDNNLEALIGKSVKVYVTVGGNEYMVKAIPEVLENKFPGPEYDRLVLTIERQLIPAIGRVTAFRIEGLVVRTTVHPQEDYCVYVSHSKSCFMPSCLNVDVVRTVGTITIDEITQCPVAGGRVTVKGHVFDTEGIAMPTTWPVIIEYVQPAPSVPYGVPCTLCPPYDTFYVPVCVSDPNLGEAVPNDECLGAPYLHQNPNSCVCIAPVITHVTSDGYFEATITVPGVADATNSIIARTPEVEDNNMDSGIQFYYDTADYLVPAESLEDMAYKLEEDDNHFLRGFFHQNITDCEGNITGEFEKFEHAWVYSDPESITTVSGDPKYITIEPNLVQIDCDDPLLLTVVLRDKFGNETDNAAPCGDVLAPLKVDLKSFFVENGVEVPFGLILANDNGQPGAEVEYIVINPGESTATAFFKAIQGGVVTIQAGAIINGVNELTEICDLEVNCLFCMLEPKVLVECEQISPNPNDPNEYEYAKAGWPVKISVHYDPALPNTILEDDSRTSATLRVELLVSDQSGLSVADGATWDTEAFVDGDRLVFNAVGSNGSFDTFVHPGGVSYDSIKSDFFVYVPDDYCGPLLVKVVDEEKHLHDIVMLWYTTPTELVRELAPDIWQLISTPKELAGDGTMESLLGGTYFSDMLLYDKNDPNGPWVQITDPDYELMPQYGYLLNMTQKYVDGPDCVGQGCGYETCIQADYVFARSTAPVLPGSRPLNLGWNLVGPSFDENIHFDRGEQIWTEYGPVWTACEPYFECPCGNPYDLLTEGDNLSRMLGSACADCKTLVNWGGEGLDHAYDIGGPTGVEIELWGEPNSMGNLGNFSAASVNSGTLGGWAIDPSTLYGFNGDAYWLYVTSPQTLTSNTILDMADVQP